MTELTRRNFLKISGAHNRFSASAYQIRTGSSKGQIVSAP